MKELSALAEEFGKKASKALKDGDIPSAQLWIEAANMTLAKVRNMPAPPVIKEREIIHDYRYPRVWWGTTDTYTTNAITITANSDNQAFDTVAWYKLTRDGVELAG